MGGKVSRPSNHTTQRNNGHPGGVSTEEDDNDDKCALPPCFFGWNPKHDDPIGSPMPDTPVLEKRRRYEQQQQEQQPFVSTSYYGMEREAASLRDNGDNGMGGLLLPPSKVQQQQQQTNNGSNGHHQHHQTNITEGPDCERELYKKYEILEVLGVGSTSTVHKCRRKDTNQYFAVKIIDVHLMDEKFQGMMTQFQIEIQALQQLHHPGIIKLYDVYVNASKIFIIMEYLEGGELFDYVVQKGTLTEEEASMIVKKVTSAIVFMHEQNIVHRDLKPENLLLVRRPSNTGTTKNQPIDVKIIDFGLSKAMEVSKPLASTFLGTRGYLAPEMLQRQDYTKAVDSWALGVIVFVLLCGCLPFDDDSAAIPETELHARFELRFPRWAKNLSESAKDLLKKLLDINPSTRYTAMQALRHPWVQGKTTTTALLASPARIQATPKSMRAARRKQCAMGSPPQNGGVNGNHHVRKSSL